MDEVFVGGGVAVAVEVTMDVVIGGSARVGGISIEEHSVRFEERQQNDVALGDARPQY